MKSPDPTSPSPANSWWHPSPGLTWQWQLDEEIDTSIEAEVYDIDLYADQAGDRRTARSAG